MSCLMCCFSFCSLCGCRDMVLRMTAFQPPSPNYEISPCENNPATLQLVLIDNKKKKNIPKDIDCITCKAFWLETKNNNRIPALYFQNANTKLIHASDPKHDHFLQKRYHTVILYSHGNSTDLGRIRDYLLDMSYTLNVDIFAYEYNGYGVSQGKPSDFNLLYDIEAAYDYLVHKLNYPWHRIMVYGRSIGSGPSIFLASNPHFRVGGLILHSPIASGARVLNFNLKESPNYDMFPNSEMISHVKCPTYIFHGDQDREVPLKHGKLLATNAKNLYETWWVQGAGHNDIDYKFRWPYYIKIATFLKKVKQFQDNELTMETMNQFYTVENWIVDSKHIYFTKKNITQKETNINTNTQKLIDDSSLQSESSFIGPQSNSFVLAKMGLEKRKESDLLEKVEKKEKGKKLALWRCQVKGSGIQILKNTEREYQEITN